jgi:hypothetical protein
VHITADKLERLHVFPTVARFRILSNEARAQFVVLTGHGIPLFLIWSGSFAKLSRGSVCEGWRGRVCSRDAPRKAYPACIFALRRARSRRDGFTGVKASGHNSWGVLIQALNDSAR